MPTPETDIGPIYKGLAALALAFALGILTLHATHGDPIGLYDVIFIGIVILLCLCLWRPNTFDMLIKTIADHLPFLSFSKTASIEQDTQEMAAHDPPLTPGPDDT